MKQVILTEQETEELILVMLSRDPVKLHNAINFLQTKKEQSVPLQGPIVDKSGNDMQ